MYIRWGRVTLGALLLEVLLVITLTPLGLISQTVFLTAVPIGVFVFGYLVSWRVLRPVLQDRLANETALGLIATLMYFGSSRRRRAASRRRSARTGLPCSGSARRYAWQGPLPELLVRAPDAERLPGHEHLEPGRRVTRAGKRGGGAASQGPGLDHTAEDLRSGLVGTTSPSMSKSMTTSGTSNNSRHVGASVDLPHGAEPHRPATGRPDETLRSRERGRT